VADDEAADNGPDDLTERRDGGQCAEPADARKRTVRLGHDALPTDRGRRVPDAERGRRERDGPDLLCDNESEGRCGPYS
jgi:hypothetical protein